MRARNFICKPYQTVERLRPVDRDCRDAAFVDVVENVLAQAHITVRKVCVLLCVCRRSLAALYGQIKSKSHAYLWYCSLQDKCQGCPGENAWTANLLLFYKSHALQAQ